MIVRDRVRLQSQSIPSHGTSVAREAHVWTTT
jgi:hypothetical protein